LVAAALYRKTTNTNDKKEDLPVLPLSQNPCAPSLPHATADSVKLHWRRRPVPSQPGQATSLPAPAACRLPGTDPTGSSRKEPALHCNSSRDRMGCDRETKKRKYLDKTIHGGWRDAQAHLNA
jgi:hypothetical protein